MPIPQSGEQYLRLQADPNQVSVSVDREAGIGWLLQEDILRSFQWIFFFCQKFDVNSDDEFQFEVKN